MIIAPHLVLYIFLFVSNSIGSIHNGLVKAWREAVCLIAGFAYWDREREYDG